MADGNQFDLNEMMRKAMLMRDLQATQNAQGPPSNIAGNVNYQPPQDQAQQDINRMRAYQPPPTADFEKAAQEYAQPLHKPTYGEYKMNKPLAVAMGLFGLKNFARDPKKEIENINYVARKGYRQAEEKYEETSAERERAFKTQSELYDKRATMYSHNITNAGNIASKQMELDRAQREAADWPLQHQKALYDLIESQDKAKKLGQPVPGSESFVVTTPDGKHHMAFRRAYPPGSEIPYDFALDDGKIVKPGEGVSFIPYNVSSETAYKDALADEIAEFKKTHDGRDPAPGKEHEQLLKNAEDAAADATTKRMLAQQEFSRGQEEKRANEVDYRNAVRTTATDINKIGDQIRQQLENIKEVKNTLAMARAGDKAGVLAKSGEIQYIMSTGGGLKQNLSRYPMKELQDYEKQTGTLEDLWQKYVANLMGSKTGTVPPGILDQMEKQVGMMEEDLTGRLEVANQYTEKLGATGKTRDAEAARDLQPAFNRALTNYSNRAPGSKTTPETKPLPFTKEQLEQERQRRLKLQGK